MFGKLFKVGIYTLLAYLLQATVPFHIALWEVAPNIALAMVAVVSIGLGRKYTFLMSLTVGYLLEIMLPVLDYISLILYPVCAMLGALVFSDKSERKLEEERSTGRRAKMLDPHLRTPLCALLSMFVFKTVNLMYIYLSGVTLTGLHILQAFIDTGYSTAIAAVIQFPARWWLGVYRIKKAR